MLPNEPVFVDDKSNIIQFWEKVVAVYLLVFHFFTSKIWFANVLFPKVPICNFFETPIFLLEKVTYILLVISLLGVLLLKNTSFVIKSYIFFQLLLICFDINQLQPYIYQNLLFFFILLLAKSRNTKVDLILLLLFSTYFFSGLNKFSGAFLHEIWDNFLLKKTFHNCNNSIFLHYFGLLVPVLETGFAVGLLFKKFRKHSIYLLVAMHISIICVLLISKSNYIVIPWNLLQIIFLLSIKRIEMSKIVFNKTVVFFVIPFFIIPVLYLFKCMDFAYLSFDLYSGKTKNMYLYFSDSKLANKYNKQLYIITKNKKEKYCINIRKWSEKEIYIQPFPSKYYYKKMIKIIGSENKNQTLEFKITQYPYTKPLIINQQCIINLQKNRKTYYYAQ